MLVIGIDTSGRQGSVAVCRGDADGFEILQLTSLEGGTYSAQLTPQISAALQESKIEKADLDGFAVVSGPGSFTGLRVGLATAKGLCEVLHKPLATVSMLEALALSYGHPGEAVTAVQDAGRGEVYVGEYFLLNGRARLIREYIVKLDEFAEAGIAMTSLLLTPNATLADFLRKAKLDVRLVDSLQADQIARIGIDKLLGGDVADPITVDVNYIRRSDAEIFSAPKR
jgi:tRNA threonylcarbamoyladenosine biosynthesis protein TsaB